MDGFRFLSKFRAGLCVVWLSLTISVPCVGAWADEPLLINPTPLGGINLGGASPEGAPNGNFQVDDDTLVPKYTPGLNTGGMDTGRVDDDTLAPKYTPGLNTGGMDTGRVDDDTLAPKYTPGLNTGGMDTSASQASAAGEGRSRSSFAEIDHLGLSPLVKKLLGGG